MRKHVFTLNIIIPGLLTSHVLPLHFDNVNDLIMCAGDDWGTIKNTEQFNDRGDYTETVYRHKL